MELMVKNTKYSIFGKYDFLEATSENVSKLYEIFGKDHFLPNMIQMIHIERSKNNISKVLRPQFINEDMKCSVTFLPDRIDIETKEGKELALEKIIEYYEKIIQAFQLKINRIALNSSAVLRISAEEKSEILKKGIVGEKYYPYVDDLIEWETRNVSRKKCEELEELINVGQDIESIGMTEGEGVSIKQIKVDTDINTLAEKKAERFDASSCKIFFLQAIAWKKEMLDNLKGIA